MTYAVNKISLPGKAETFTIIIDLIGCTMTTMPIYALRKFLGTVQTNFRGRGFKTLILNANMMIRGSFSLFRTVLDEFTCQKLNMLGSDYKVKMLTFIPAEQLEVRFGGNLTNKTKDFFPPDMSIPGVEMITRAEYTKLSLQEIKEPTLNKHPQPEFKEPELEKMPQQQINEPKLEN